MRKLIVHDHMTHVVKIHILTDNEDKGHLHFNLKIIFHRIFNINALQALHDAPPLRLHQAKWPSLISVHRPVMLYICNKFCEIIWKDISKL